MKKIALLIAIALTQFNAKAQELEEFLVLGKDAGTLMQNYLKPAFEGTIYNLSSGWYRTAKPHKLLGLDITLNATMATVSNGNKNFYFRNGDYDNLYIQGTNKNDLDASIELPTAFGGDTNTKLVYEQEGTFNLPGGNTITETRKHEFSALSGLTEKTGFDQVPLAMIQAGIGFGKKTDLTIRYVPEVGGEDFKTNLIGFGLKHNILQYFPVAKRIPLVDVSLFGGYTKLTSKYIPGENQSIDMEVTSLTGQLLGSVDLKIVNFFVGLGYTKGESSLVVNGNYKFEYDVETTPGNYIKITRDIEQDDLPNLKNNVNSFMTTAGMSLNLAFFKIYGSYTLQEYNAVNAGIAFSFR